MKQTNQLNKKSYKQQPAKENKTKTSKARQSPDCQMCCSKSHQRGKIRSRCVLILLSFSSLRSHGRGSVHPYEEGVAVGSQAKIALLIPWEKMECVKAVTKENSRFSGVGILKRILHAHVSWLYIWLHQKEEACRRSVVLFQKSILQKYRVFSKRWTHFETTMSLKLGA